MRLLPAERDFPITELADGVLVLEESRRYRLVLDEARPARTIRFGGRVLNQIAGANTFSLEISHWVGEQQLEVHRESGIETIPVHVIPRAEKVDAERWPRLLAELDAWLPGVTFGLEGGLHGHVDRHGAEGPLLALALLPLVPALDEALVRLLAAPREALVRRTEEVRAHAIRRVDAQGVRWLVSHPSAARAVLQPSPGDVSPLVPRVRGALTFDHPANRYVAWLVRRAVQTLEVLANRLTRHASTRRPSATDGSQWSGQRALECRAAARQLGERLRQGFLREVRPQPLGDAALATILDDPHYARVHALGGLLLSPRFQLESEAAAASRPAPVRPSYELYELWVLLAVGRRLQRAFPEARAKWSGLKGLREPESAAGGAELTLEIAMVGQLSLLFNPTFPGYFNSRREGRHSLTTERRPDLVLTWKPLAGTGSWMALDAKYRVSRQNLGEAFSSAHLYRDSLRWPQFGGSCAAAFLVAPARQPEISEWFDPDFLREHGLGALELAPGGADDVAWLAPVLEALGAPH